MKRVLVTGATGFVGRHLVARLTGQSWSVTAHGHGEERSLFDGAIEYVRGDLADPGSAAHVLAPWRWDAVVNLAGPVTGGGEDLATGIAVVGAHARIALHVRQHARDARIVHVSSMTVYGLPTRVPVDEDHPRRPMHLYGLAKQVAEDIMLAGATDTWVLRVPGLFSEQRRAGALFHFCRAARAGEPVRVTATTPTPWDLLHVDDAVLGIASALDASGTGGAFNISHGEPVELVAIARAIAALGGRSAIEHPDVAHPVFQLDISRARARLAWNPPTLEERLRRLYDAYGAQA